MYESETTETPQRHMSSYRTLDAHIQSTNQYQFDVHTESMNQIKLETQTSSMN